MALKAVLVTITLAALVGCVDHAGEVATKVAADGDPMSELAEMEVVPGMTMNPAVVTGMQAYLDRLAGASVDSMVAMRPRHLQMMTNFLALMNQEVTDMGMTADPTWLATFDTVRSDLSKLPTMGEPEMEAFVPEHAQRLQRLIVSHETMMKEMGH